MINRNSNFMIKSSTNFKCGKDELNRLLSIVIPMKDEAENVSPLYKKLKASLEKIQYNYEIFFIDDGSTDSTYQELVNLSNTDNHLKIIKLRKNFGKATALSTGFKYVSGSIVITMDGDLQDDPEEIPRFIAKIEEGYDLVSGWKHLRLDPLTKTLPSKIFNRLACILTGVNLHDFNCGFKAYRRGVIDSLHLYGEMHRYIPALAAWSGFNITEIPVHHNHRLYGKSKYGFSRLIKGLLDLITVKFLISYSSRPLHVFGVPGICSLLVGGIIGFYLLILKYFENIRLSERPLLMLSIVLVFIGFQFISLGLLGEMITYREAREENNNRFIETIVGI